MPRKVRNKKSNQVSVIVASLLLLLSLPLVVYGLLQKSFDIRNRAYDMLELSEKNPCIISFPNVNPYSLEVGKSIRIQVDAKFSNSGIKKLEVSNSEGKILHTEEFPDSPLQMGTSFTFTPEKSGGIDILAMVEKTDGGSAGCKINSPYDIKGLRAIASNSSPEFTSKPSQSKPSQDIKTGTQYEYQLSASDKDGDRINYSYSFTPRAEWLKPVIIEDGANGKLSITFRGYTEKPASYLANVIIHDGYSKHVRSQSWVISVEQAENDIPKVKVLKPEEALRIDTGKSFDSLWEVSDLNHISSFELFMAKNVADEASWKKVSEKLPYNVLGSSVSTDTLESGTYKLVVRATDNQNPPKSGFGVSPEIVLSKASDNIPPTDDVVLLGEPQVTNMSPSTEDNVSNPRATIKGTIIASEGAEIKESSISFKVDDKDVTDKMKINKISENEYTLIYQPTEDLIDGVHKGEISFEDTKDKEVTKTWEFTINSLGDTSGIYNIFGIEISKRTAFIIGIGILLIVIAICIPLLIAAIWGKGKRDEKETTYATRNTPTTEYAENMYNTAYTNTDMEGREVKEPYLETISDTPIIEKEAIFTPVVEEIQEEEPKRKVTYSNVSDIDMDVKVDTKKEEPIFKPISETTPTVTIEKEEPIQSQVVEETIDTTVKTEVPEIKTEEPKSAFDINIQTKEETPTLKPITEQTPTVTIKTEVPEIKIQEPKSAFDVNIEPKPVLDMTSQPTQQEVVTEPTPTTVQVEEIPEPEAPDPSAFLKIAQQIEEQTKEDTSSSSTNT